MEQLYEILHTESRPRRRRVVGHVDLSFLTGKGSV